MEDTLVPIAVCGFLFIGLPWVIFHYVTQWKRSSGLSLEDEKLLDELHDLARRLDDRMNTIERIVAADNPGWRPGLGHQTTTTTDYQPGSSADRSYERSRDR